MSKPTIIAVTVVLFVVASIGVVWFVVFGSFDELTAEPAPRVDYSGVETADEIIAREYERFRQLHLSTETYDLHPSAQAIVDDMDKIRSEEEFRQRVTRDLYQILRRQAEDFHSAHPGYWKDVPTPESSDNREFNSSTVAALPYALGTQEEMDRIKECRFVQTVTTTTGYDYDTNETRPVEKVLIEKHGDAVKEFLELSAPLADKLHAASKKERVIFPYDTNYDPEARLPLPFPMHWIAAMRVRIQVQLLTGAHDEARKATFSILDVLERSGLSKDMIGSLYLYVYTDQFIYHVVTPLALAGVLSDADLDEIYRRGAAIGHDVGYIASEVALADILQFLAPQWTQNPETGTAGIPKAMVDHFGKVGVDEWFERLESERPDHIEVFGAELDAMRSGEYVLRTEEDYRRCSKFCARVIDPLIHGDLQEAIADAYLSQARWVEVRIRTEERKKDVPFRSWSYRNRGLEDFPGIRLRWGGEYLEVYSDDAYFGQFGALLERENPEFRIHGGVREED